MGYKLGDMAHLRWLNVLSAGLIGLMACRGEKAAERKPGGFSGASSTALPGLNGAVSQWDVALGGAFVLPSSPAGDTTVWVFRPLYVESPTDTGTFDVGPLVHHSFDLFNRSGLVSTAQLTSARPLSDDPCDDFPAGGLSIARGGWTVALESGTVTAVPLDSIESMRSSDSALFAAQVTRLVSSLPETRDSIFSSVPFAVRSAYRFRAGGVEGILAMVQRSIPSEANPRQDNTTFIAERPVGSAGAYEVGFVKRSAGPERDAEAVNILALVTTKTDRRPVLLVKYEYYEGVAAGIVERAGPHRWISTWVSGAPGC